MVLWAVSNSCVVVRDITYYIYCMNTASWCQMKSPTAAQELSDVASINAPVNYVTEYQVDGGWPHRVVQAA